MAEITKEDVLSFLDNMSVMELSGMVKELEDRWGVSAAPAVVAGAGMAVGGGEAAAEEAKDEFDVILVGFENKIKVLKEVRAITGLGLKEAKEAVEGAPTPIKEGVSKDEAEELKKKLEEATGKVEVK